MKSRYLLFITITLLFASTNILAQSELRLKANSSKDTVFLGASVDIELLLEGIDLKFELERDTNKYNIYNNFLSGYKENDKFHMKIKVTPKEPGINEYGPFGINVLGKEIISNKISIYTIEGKEEEVTILIPSKGKVNEEVEIKILNLSKSGYGLKLKKFENFKIKTQSTSTSIVNGKYTKTISMKVIFVKEGELLLDKNSFENLPKHVTVKPAKILVE